MSTAEAARRWSLRETVERHQAAMALDPLFRQRMEICSMCAHRVAGQCSRSGWQVTIKALTGGTCPEGLWPGQQRGVHTTQQRPVAVVVTSHNYGHHLAEALESVLGSTHRPAEILVVDDASTDNTRQVAEEYGQAGVRYLRVENRNCLATRLAGLRATRSPFVMFLDADDVLAGTYLQDGLAQFDDPTVGIVTSNMELFGDHTGTHQLDYSPERMARLNCTHAGCIHRRVALEQSRALEAEGITHATHEDWWTGRKVVADGWKVGHNPTPYRYRKHAGSMLASRSEQPGGGYYTAAALDRERITVFTAFSGRGALLQDWEGWLWMQTWPQEQLQVVAADCSRGDRGFSRELRSVLAAGLKAGLDVRHMVIDAGQTRGLADDDRATLLEVRAQVRRVVARIYARMVQELTTEYVLVLEDDVVPPADAIERLLHSMGPDVASVSGAYRSRYHSGWVVLDDAWRPVESRPAETVTQVAGNGFGCVLVRASVLRQAVLCANSNPPDPGIPFADYDLNFYHWLRNRTPYRALVDWGVECQHLEATGAISHP